MRCKMSNRILLCCIALIVALSGILTAAPAQAWPVDDGPDARTTATGGGAIQWPLNGLGFCLADGYQGVPRLLGDGAQGVIAVWGDRRTTANDSDIFAQRISGAGAPLWTSNGVAVTDAAGDQIEPEIATDSAGGVLVAWNDLRSGRAAIFAQRLDATGKTLWAAGGVTVTEGSADFVLSQLLTDGSGGAFMIWERYAEPEERLDTNLFAQRLDGSGSLVWSQPVTITAAPGEQFDAAAAPDGSGGFIVAWSDLRQVGDPNLYAQRISGAGQPLWTADGALVSSDAAAQYMGRIAPDGQGGAFVAWHDYRLDGLAADVFLMRLTATGAPAWSSDLALTTDTGLDERPADLIADGSGGAIVLADASNTNVSGSADVLAQRVDAAGALLWGAQPIVVTPWNGQQRSAVAAPDGRGGVFVAWMDAANATTAFDIVTQHLDAQGAARWSSAGVAAAALVGAQENPRIIGDGVNGLIVAWQDERHQLGAPDLFAQRIRDLNLVIFPLVRRNSPVNIH